ncbi:hypothetical protein Cpir12675_004024 [Ceratocystis pirilliformis]|uniref:Uncharacterized protein n=1 Tax=Ceratocystis pirilliformis TaxID=259994 RepID=A0ABR3Z0I1_9PEZI
MIPIATLALALASTAFASPLVTRTGEDIKPLEISNMEVSCVKTAPSDSLFHCTLNYDMNDPNVIDAKPSIKPKATCTHHWDWDGQTAEKGPQNSYTPSALECYSDGISRTIRSGLYHFSSPADIQLTLHSSYYKDLEAKLFVNLFYQHVTVAALESVQDTEMSKIWSYRSVQRFESPNVFLYPTTTKPDETAT